jgi:peptidoglycan DL-endopeptidase CwlO
MPVIRARLRTPPQGEQRAPTAQTGFRQAPYEGREAAPPAERGGVARRIPFLVFLALLIAPAASATDPAQRKQHVDQRLEHLHDRIATARVREDVLRSQIGSVSTSIRQLEAQVGDVGARLSTLEEDLSLHRRRLTRLTELFRLQSRHLRFLRRQYRLALERLERRVVAIYETGEVGTLDVVLSAATFADVLEQVDFANRIRSQDERIAFAVGDARDELRVQRAHTRATKARVAAATRTLAVRTEQVRHLHESLLARENQLSASRAQKQQVASQLRESLQEMVSEAGALQQASADLAAKLKAAEAQSPAASTGGSSSSGLIWPVSGPVVSPFGYRCLAGVCRMHEGIDIGVGYSTPIHAAAAGTVVFAGVEGGYGNLTLIDHGGGLATAYAHQSGFAVGGGAHVAQGQVIGYVGCTGHCFGPHLHFEVRVNGTAVDPLGYL